MNPSFIIYQPKQTKKMRSKTMVVTAVLLLVMWVSIPIAQSANIDIIAAPYGAKADGKTDIMKVRI